MERLTKAAVATGGAAVLLLGGAGTVAYWTAQGTASEDALSSGTFDLADGTCGGWTYLDDGEDGGEPVTAVVPGDSVTTTCTFEVTATGDHVGIGAVTVTDPQWTAENGLATQLGDAEVVSTTLDGVPFTGPVSAATGNEVDVRLAVTFDGPGATNESQGLTAALDTISVTLEQAPVPGPAAP
ncbi:hypothetical protein DNL40_06430 [Xylanimonas oleitrophica]|uniref:Alternate signal-mediated exported protein, RER_14450 family n=1 Tax=Xylanimonas oleitrophica TaxID=2607479 RepID=A0A2W5WZE0_9MICO|nr:alternate-type signal peptide domain-containing protein [Xylanimonas oleitrophica]PZR53756.1 hypothetical protein DNL40_06430 [Xylanimonas oleitrophica]